MGQFLLNRGAQTYGGTQVLTPASVDLISTPSPYATPAPASANNTYGHAAWIGYGGMPPETAIPPVSLYSAAGAGKNMSWVLPAFRMVVGRNALVPAGASLSQHAFHRAADQERLNSHVD